MLRVDYRSGFTLIELLTVTAIIALLAAIAIPQMLKFRYKSIRTEAIVTANAAQKAQIAYFASANHYEGCSAAANGGYCSTYDVMTVTDVVNLNSDLGLTTLVVNGIPITPHGYVYSWEFMSAPLAGQPEPGYGLALQGVIVPGDNPIFNDSIIVGMHDQFFDTLCGPHGYQNGVLFQWIDEILKKDNCS